MNRSAMPCSNTLRRKSATRPGAEIHKTHFIFGRFPLFRFSTIIYDSAQSVKTFARFFGQGIPVFWENRLTNTAVCAIIHNTATALRGFSPCGVFFIVNYGRTTDDEQNRDPARL